MECSGCFRSGTLLVRCVIPGGTLKFLGIHGDVPVFACFECMGKISAGESVLDVFARTHDHIENLKKTRIVLTTNAGFKIISVCHLCHRSASCLIQEGNQVPPVRCKKCGYEMYTLTESEYPLKRHRIDCGECRNLADETYFAGAR